MHGYHQPGLAVLSLLIAILASYTALDLSGRVSTTSGATRRVWLLGGSVAMGIGIWSMHFVAMLAFRLPVPIRYNTPLWLLSVVIAAVASLLALVVVSGRDANLRRVAAAAPLMGMAIAGMHYTGMAAMRVPAEIRYDALLVTVSVGIAIAASFAALWLALHFREAAGHQASLGKAGSAILMGMAICGMHYTGMAAVRFEPSTAVFIDSGADLVATRGLAIGVLFTTLMILGLALFGITMDRRYQRTIEVTAASADAALRAEIGERLEVQARLKESEASYHSLFNSLSEMVYVIDADGRFVDANDAVMRAFGYSRDEIVGQTPALLLDPARVDPTLSARRIDRARAGELLSFESWGRRKSGEAFPLDVVLSPATYFGAPVVLAAARDSTDRRQAEAERAAAQARYRRLAEAAPYGIFMCDRAGTLIELNPAATDIFSGGAAVGQSLTGLLAEEDRSRISDELAKLTFTSRPLETEVRIGLSPEEHRLLAVTLTLVQEGELSPVVHGIARDITAERQREAQLRRAERLAGVGTLVGGVAHELNNPLTAIKSFAELMLLDERADADLEALSIVRHEADRAAQIVSDLRLLARGTQDDARKAREIVDLNEVVRHALRLRRYNLETHNIEIDEGLAPLPVQILGDRGQMDQVVLNLIVNAGHALEGSSTGRRLSIRTRVEADHVGLEVADTGIGIRPADMERIFDPFWTTKSPGEGTGLGLSLVHSIVSDHGGAVGVQSQPGQGATFRLRFPLAPAVMDTQRLEATGIAPARRSLRLLIVEDEVGIRRALERYLQRRGHKVDTAADGAEALRVLDEAAHDVSYDVILSDLRMPGIGGDRLLEELRARGTGLDRRIIFMSGDAASPGAARLMESSAVPVIYKPFNLSDLAESLEDFAGPAPAPLAPASLASA